MPYLRFSRDERGYEHTYVLHGLRTGSRPKLLYWFRTPPNMNVGRLPLDEDAIRAIEDSNADLTFDWARMLRVKPAPAAARDDVARRPRPRSERRATAGARRGAAASRAEEEKVSGAGRDSGQEAIPAGGRGHPVVVLVGDDGLARLRAQYAELRARLAASAAEPGVLDSVTRRVEALNPDVWRPGEDAVRGVERFETEAAAIKSALGRRRRRSPRGRRPTGSPPAAGRTDERGETTSE